MSRRNDVHICTERAGYLLQAGIRSEILPSCCINLTFEGINLYKLGTFLLQFSIMNLFPVLALYFVNVSSIIKNVII